ncbi:hypothetical protein AUI46_02620 [archaeon 13_1_40CM_2_52_13]|nr:MAG: hypothetical protein AUI46_02620 [archaeon 13_1_40CM_2_52_13]OLE71388.1 MAG: hypothetical protein AUF78_01955 [archaeon 13_1_20CM_2_51_12]TMI40724.1 MAG: hypothetical protein E6H21_05325 [Candidatus Bathyarchaeota archaeon]
MFVGHFAIAFLLWRLFPQVPLPVVLIAVSFPDLLWSLLVPAGVEKVRINPDSPLQKFIVFEKFPYSHSLVLGSVWSLPVGLLIAGLLNTRLVVPVFVAGSASHWLLDTVVHLKDLPVLGFDGDRKVGAGLWKRGPVAFVVEYAFYAIVTLFALSGLSLVYALILGGVFHAINFPSFFGSMRKNSVKSSNGYAGLALLGFGSFTLIASLII